MNTVSRKPPASHQIAEPCAVSTRYDSYQLSWFRGLLIAWVVIGCAIVATTVANASDGEAKIIAALDTEYQAAVQKNDFATMDRLLADDFTLVTGSGKIYHKADLLNEARSGHTHYDRQDDTEQTVRLWGDTAVITAKLTAKGDTAGEPFEYSLWFSDTYVRTPHGWRYVFGQASSPLTK